MARALVTAAHAAMAMDSQAKYAAVSRKQADVYLRPAPRHWGMKVWDHAAGIGRIADHDAPWVG